MSTLEPVAIGMAGLGGYARFICDLLREQSARPDAPIRLKAVCEPDLTTHAGIAAELRDAGISVYSRWDDLLVEPLQAVWLPLPTPLHRPFTEQSLAAGKAVICEKPAAGSVQDVDAMIAARDRSGLPAVIGFQDIYEPPTLALKRLLLDGEIGAIRSATIMAHWPRDSRYYGRSAWAGRQKLDDAWVMDSPASNAIAHYLNLALFFLGTDENLSANVVDIEAELYRANPIENYDTCGMRIGTSTGASLVALLTHACRRNSRPEIVLHGERGTVTYVTGQGIEISNDAGTRTLPLIDSNRVSMVERFANLVRGIADERLVSTLEVARTHQVVVNGASEATPVMDILADLVDILPQEDGLLRAIPGIEELFTHCAQAQCLPHESGLAAWTAPAGKLDLRGYDCFRGPAPLPNPSPPTSGS